MVWKIIDTLRGESKLFEVYQCNKCGEIEIILEGDALGECPRCGDNYDLETS